MKPWVLMLIGAMALVYFFVPMAIGLIVGAVRVLIVLVGLAIEVSPFLIGGFALYLLIKALGKKA